MDTNYYISLTCARNNADAVYGINIRSDKLFTDRIYPYYSSSVTNGTWLVAGYVA
ncbi:hypothetical protein J6W34_00240 [bacterium]|nr:hypothetical protein [bacterium]